MTQPDEASLRQIEAARPDRSTWLGANAGSGKTRVLTNRVARLLLSGVAPQNILCLTYTKAAAGEMQNRLFATLGAWAMKPDAALTEELGGLGEAGLDSEALLRARRLFARAIETPGGLKIQTIHSFCAALLRRFPLEAGVSPQFAEVDERGLGLLIDTVIEAMADGPQAPLIDALALQMPGEGKLHDLCREILHRREAFPAHADAAAIRAELGVPAGETMATILHDTFEPGDADLLETLVRRLLTKQKTDLQAGEALAPFAPFAPSVALLAALEGSLLYRGGAANPFGPKRGKFPTKATRTELGPLAEALDDLMDRVAAARSRRIALTAAERTEVLHRFAAAFLPRMAAAKAARGWLDFDDLILRTRALLTDPAVAQWVLYKLDGGIDHILVDEAQDTSPDQWEVIRLLAQEFTAGDSGRGQRTIFVVGDRKQSIYSFQGADPREFTRMQAHFGAELDRIGAELHDRGLAHSFRSAPAVLAAVDATFAAEPGGLGQAPAHMAFRAALPGRVDLWPVVPKSEQPEAQENASGWDPVDRIDPHSASVQLAGKIAAEVARMIREECLPAADGSTRPLGPGDVLILFRRRQTLFFECMRALKAAGLDVAGADRIRLGEELAVRDLLALLSFLALPEDDLSLAAALRSPLFGWTEDELFRLAHPRPVGSYLWAALRRSDLRPETFGILDDLRNQTDYLRPFDLIDRVLTRHNGRRRLVARLGPDCEDAIDALLDLALAYEQAEIPSLTGFLEWMAAEEVELKRQAEAAGRRIRLMTVHGAKGLEAPVVILPDCAEFSPRKNGMILPRAGSWPAWAVRAEDRPPAFDADAAVLAASEAEERDRLLYVAMTRAEQWLIVAAAGDLGKQGSWHHRVEAGLRVAGAATVTTAAGEILRLGSGLWAPPPAVDLPEDEGEPAPPPCLPAWTRTRAGDGTRPLPSLPPSGLGGAKALPGEGAEEALALATGLQVHRLLELLPGHAPAGWAAMAPGLIGSDAAPESVAALLAEAAGVLTAPHLAHLFTADPRAETLAEVPVAAHVAALNRTVAGTIDRLIVTAEEVLAIDFKTNRTVPDCPEAVPEGLLRQMGAYRAVLARIYPDRTIRTALLWTRTAALMPLPDDLVIAALARATPTS